MLRDVALAALRSAAAAVGVMAAFGLVARLRRFRPAQSIDVPGCGQVAVSAVQAGRNTLVTLDWEAIFGSLGFKIPFSSASVTPDGTIHVAGTIGLRPPAGAKPSVVDGGPRAEAERALELIEAKLKACGAGVEHITMVHCFLVNFTPERFAEMNAGYLNFWGERALPPRITTGCGGLALGSSVEIDVVAKV